MHAEHDVRSGKSGRPGLGILFGIALIGLAVILVLVYAFG